MSVDVEMPLFARPHIEMAPRSDGCLLLRSVDPLQEYPTTIVHSLRAWAEVGPDHPLVAERDPEGRWRTCSYGELVLGASAIGQALLEQGLGANRPLVVLSGNSVDHLLLTMGAMTAGIPVAPISVAHSLQSRDHARIRAIAELIGPGAVFADDSQRFGPALDALGRIPAIVSRGDRPGARRLGDLESTAPGRQLAEAFSALTPDSVAKILFTSGSTGTPKGVVNTHRMLSANQQMMRQAWPFLRRERPVIVDWLPWSHTFGGNNNVGMTIVAGGAIYIDAGRPLSDQFAPTLTNLKAVPPTIYFNVPAGYAHLVPALEADPEFARRFFSRLRLMVNAGAALPAALRGRLTDLCRSVTDRVIPVTGCWGATETAPAVTTANFDFADARCIGAPLPGAEVKLVPCEGAFEIRVRGPMVSPGYFGHPELEAEAFDDEGFYRSGDAVALVDAADPNAGLLFRGRIAEDFKLATGTFVRVGALRTALLSAIPILADAVITGEDRDYVGAMVWLNAGVASTPLSGDVRDERVGADGYGAVVLHEELRRDLLQVLADHNACAGSAARVERLVVMSRPADLDAGEITDKGYVNQRRVLKNRAALVDLLYADRPATGVVIAGEAQLAGEDGSR
jgi:feruloyl-CoA synthase